MSQPHNIHLKDMGASIDRRPMRRVITSSGGAGWWTVAIVAALVALALVLNTARAEETFDLPPPPVAVDALGETGDAQAAPAPEAIAMPAMPGLPGVPDEPGIDVADLEILSPENINSVSELWSSDSAEAPSLSPLRAARLAAAATQVRGPQGPQGIRRAVLPAAEPLVPEPAAESTADPAAGRELASVLQAVGAEAGGRPALEQMLYDQLRAAMPDQGAGFLFEKATLPAQLKLPQGAFSARFDFRLPQRGVGAAPFTGQVFTAQGQPGARLTGSVWIDREAAGVQATRVIQKGEVIQPGDLKTVSGRLSQLPRGVFEDATALEGQSVRQELRPGVWVTDQMLFATKIIKRGQAVTMRLARGPITLSAPGLAQQDGVRGAVIKVANLSSEREIFARVINADEVEVIQ